MNPQEINEAVARKLGWVSIRSDNWKGQITKSGIFQYWKLAKRWENILSDYCHSIEAAWEIVDKYKKHGTNYPSYFRLHACDNGRWVASWHQGTQLCDGPEVEIEADTAPMAIALCFLKLP